MGLSEKVVHFWKELWSEDITHTTYEVPRVWPSLRRLETSRQNEMTLDLTTGKLGLLVSE